MYSILKNCSKIFNLILKKINGVDNNKKIRTKRNKQNVKIKYNVE